jgi:hypothetical protein
VGVVEDVLDTSCGKTATDTIFGPVAPVGPVAPIAVGPGAPAAPAAVGPGAPAAVGPGAPVAPTAVGPGAPVAPVAVGPRAPVAPGVGCFDAGFLTEWNLGRTIRKWSVLPAFCSKG